MFFPAPPFVYAYAAAAKKVRAAFFYYKMNIIEGCVSRFGKEDETMLDKSVPYKNIIMRADLPAENMPGTLPVPFG